MNWHVVEVLAALALVVGAVAYNDHRSQQHEALLLAELHAKDAQNAATVQQLQATNLQLAQQLLNVQTAVAKQKATVVQLPPVQLAQETQKELGTGSVTPGPTPGTFVIDTSAAQEVLRQLMQERADAQSVQLLKDQLANDAKALAAQASTIEDAKKEIKALKAEVGRGKRKWFFIGFVAGWIGHSVVHIYGAP